MMLSDKTIRFYIDKGWIKINPLREDYIQPASVDVRLHDEIVEFNPNFSTHIDVYESNDVMSEKLTISDDKPYILHPGSFILGGIKEYLTISDDIMARVEGKSSLARYGILIHSTAGFVDPGWSGRLTLELSNLSPFPVTLYKDMKIGHLSFTKLTTKVDNPYGSKEVGSRYQNQDSATMSKYYLNRGD